MWGLLLCLDHQLTINKCQDQGSGRDCTSVQWQQEGAGSRPGGSETTLSLGYRDWEGALCPWWGAGDARPSISGHCHKDQMFPSVYVKHYDWHQCHSQDHFLCRDLRTLPYKQSWRPVSISLLKITVKYSLQSNPPINNHWAPPGHLWKVLVGRSAKIHNKCSLPTLQELLISSITIGWVLIHVSYLASFLEAMKVCNMEKQSR